MDGYSVGEDFAIYFAKVTPDYKLAKDEQYTIMPIDEELETGILIGINNDGVYSFASGYNNDFNWNPLYNMLPKIVRNELKNVNNVDDILALSGKDEGYRIYNNASQHQYRISIRIPVRIKQIKSTPGYKSDNIIYSAEVNVYYKYDNNNAITNKNIYFYTYNNYYGVIQSKEIPSYTKLSDINKFMANDIGESCINTDNQGKIITEDTSLCTGYYTMGSSVFRLIPYFVNQEGTVTFKITNTVNGLAKYNASKDNNLKYKIEVVNTGNAPSGNNVITTKVPKLVQVDETSISDNGTYNSSNHTITWNINRIDSGEKVTVFYKAAAPESTKNKELIGNSNIKSDQVTTAVQSTNTIVTLDRIVEIIKNPDTGTMVYIANTNIGVPLSILAMFVVIIAIAATVIVRKYHIKKKEIKNSC